jgi:hypothetical protein
VRFLLDKERGHLGPTALYNASRDRVPIPEITPNEVLARVRTSSSDAFDLAVAASVPQSTMEYRSPASIIRVGIPGKRVLLVCGVRSADEKLAPLTQEG